MAAKTEVYTWRVSAALKSRLENAAHVRRRSVAELLDELVAESLDTAERNASDDDRQRRLHSQARPFLGCISGGPVRRSERVRELVRARLKGRDRRAR